MQPVRRVIGFYPRVQAKPLDIRLVAGRGQPDRVHAAARLQAMRQRKRRLRGRAGDHHRLRHVLARFHQAVIDHETGREQRPEQHLLRLQLCIINGICGCEDVGIVDRRETLPVGGPVHEALLARPHRRHVEALRNRQIAIYARAHSYAVCIGFLYRRKAPDRHAAKSRIGGREEIPVAHRLAKGRVGHVVRRQCKSLDF